MARGILEIDGRRIELTDEQVEELLKSKEKHTRRNFGRVLENKYYFINSKGNVESYCDERHPFDDGVYKVANYCTNKELMQQRALHEILDRLLWRFSMENDGDKIDWVIMNQEKYKVSFNYSGKNFYVESNRYYKGDSIYFYSKEIAQKAIKEIIEPFMKEHPEFEW